MAYEDFSIWKETNPKDKIRIPAAHYEKVRLYTNSLPKMPRPKCVRDRIKQELLGTKDV